MSLWLAGLQIVRLAILTAVSIIVVQPAKIDQTQKMLEKMQANAKAPGAPPGAAAGAQVGQAMAGMGTAFAVGYLVFGSIYPVVSLILLNTTGARAACLTKKKPEGLTDY